MKLTVVVTPLLPSPFRAPCSLQNIQAEVRTYNTVISACNKGGQPEQALRVYERMLAAGAKPSATTYTTLISAYGRTGQVEKALGIYQVGLL
jgi:pentatricopeptide repeat domain-containing protein 1